MTHSVKDLSIEQKLAIESLLGRRVSDDEQINITTVPPKLTEDQRAAALENLNRYFAHVDAHRQPVSEEEEEDIINEAIRSVRPNYRPHR
jgi:hypothetical protein